MHADQKIAQLLIDHAIVKQGNFTLRSGAQSSLYVDMRRIFGNIDLLKQIATCTLKQLSPDSYDAICGVPYGAVPLATSIALLGNKPLIMMRKEVKKYGTQQRIEGVWHPGDRIILIEDVMTTGQSVLEAAKALQEEGLVVHAIVVIVDREQGGGQLLASHGYQLYALTTIHELETVSMRWTDYVFFSASKFWRCSNPFRARCCWP